MATEYAPIYRDCDLSSFNEVSYNRFHASTPWILKSVS